MKGSTCAVALTYLPEICHWVSYIAHSIRGNDSEYIANTAFQICEEERAKAWMKLRVFIPLVYITQIGTSRQTIFTTSKSEITAGYLVAEGRRCLQEVYSGWSQIYVVIQHKINSFTLLSYWYNLLLCPNN